MKPRSSRLGVAVLASIGLRAKPELAYHPVEAARGDFTGMSASRDGPDFGMPKIARHQAWPP